MSSIVKYIYAFLPSVLLWVLMLSFVPDDCKFQQNRLRKALENLHKHIKANTEGATPTQYTVTYKNKKFDIGIIKESFNNHYCTYRIFINGEEAGVYHILSKLFFNSYYFQEINHRYSSEVIAIIHAGNKVLKKTEKKLKVKTNSWNEYSYFG